MARHTIQRSTSSGTNHNNGRNFAYAKQVSDSTQHNDSESYSTNDTTNHDECRDDSNQLQTTEGNSTNEQWSTSHSYSKRKGDKDTESGDNASSENHSVQTQNSRLTSVGTTQGKTRLQIHSARVNLIAMMSTTAAQKILPYNNSKVEQIYLQFPQLFFSFKAKIEGGFLK